MIHILGYPRSGNNWAMYMIEAMSGLPANSFGHEWRGHPPGVANTFGRRQNPDGIGSATGFRGETSCYKSHWVHDSTLAEGTKLITPIRNYKEAIVRHNEHRMDQIDGAFEEDSRAANDMRYPMGPSYGSILNFWHEFPGEKLLLRYETMILDRAMEARKVAKFCGFEDSVINDFCRNIDRHFERSVGLYEAGSFTKGRSTVFHSDRLTKEQRLAWDKRMILVWPHLIDPYLVDYLEPATRESRCQLA
ncbi:MAG: sulfotransferase domain-containing protein [Planctomycetes bacterium]|nr:sulfotransferase domain-containing protein [Planctomycetota bacterium]